MRVAFVGKGGSGKTTLTSLFAEYLAYKNLPVLTIDADINQHLAQSLGLKEDNLLPPLGTEMGRIKNYLKGKNQRIASESQMIKTTPPGGGSRLIKFSESNPIFDYFQKNIHGIRIMAVGPFTEEDLGIKCYHSKTGSIELILNHMIDKAHEYILVDMTAGADTFASGLFTKFDVTILAVEPTLKSITVYNQYKNYSQNFGVNLKVIGNKIENQSDLDFLKGHIKTDDLIGTFYNSPYVKSRDKGQSKSINFLEPENLQTLEKIKNEIDNTQKNWPKFYDQMIHFHILNAKSWANAQAGTDLTVQVDPEYDFIKAIS